MITTTYPRRVVDFLPAGRYTKPVPGGRNYGYLYLNQAKDVAFSVLFYTRYCTL
jgi:hypothetical protein